jgi:NADH-quinone oxidoreductase subunit A
MPQSFIPILVLLALAAVVAGSIQVLNVLASPKLRTRQKASTYESGVPLIDASHKRISIQFFVIAMVFILFDVEIAFIFPWALVFRSAGWPLFVEMFAFLLVLAVGYAYIWKKGAFDW